MENCNHGISEEQEHDKNFMGEIFNYKAKTCCCCGSCLWNDQLEKEFMNWLDSLYQNKNNIFVVGYKLNHIEAEQIKSIYAELNSELTLIELFSKMIIFINNNQLDIKFKTKPLMGTKVLEYLTLKPKQLIVLNSISVLSDINMSELISHGFRLIIEIRKDKQTFNKMINEISRL